MAGKISNRRTEIAYKAELGWTSLPNKTKSNATRTLYSKCGGYMRERLSFLPGEVSQTQVVKLRKRSKAYCEKSAEAIVPEFFFLRKGLNNRKSLVSGRRRSTQ